MAKNNRPKQRKSTLGWLEATNQMWKLYIAFIGFGLSFLCFLGSGLSFFLGASWFTPLIVGGTFLGGVTFSWLLNTLRCPSCKNKLVWTMISSRSHLSWLVDLANLVICPSCQVVLGSRPADQWRAI